MRTSDRNSLATQEGLTWVFGTLCENSGIIPLKPGNELKNLWTI